MNAVAVADVVFVLVGTSHAGNIGAAARAMKTMGFSRLRLVAASDHLGDVPRARATGAEDVLEAAEVFATLAEAVHDRHQVIGTTARLRHLAVPVEDCRDQAERLGPGTIGGDGSGEVPTRVALVFGRERSGLSNAEIDLCSHLVQIPCNREFSSLNLGSAVQVMAYEWARALQQVVAVDEVDRPGKGKATGGKAESLPATSEAMQYFFEHLERVMIGTGFLDPDRPRHLMRRLRRYFERNRPNANELAILRGVLASTETGTSGRRPPGSPSDD